MPNVMKNLSYLSKTNGIGGKIGSSPDDFIVEEITRTDLLGIGKEVSHADELGNYAVFVLQKKMWSTQDALYEIAKCLGTSVKWLSAAGNKDRNAITVQLVSCWGVEPDRIRKLRIKDLTILGCWRSNSPVKVGDLLGNRFSIRLKDIRNLSAIKRIMKETKDFVPNYFGPQRFGLRGNNHIVGKLLVQGRFKDAANEFISGGKDDSTEAREARRAVSRDGINENTLLAFPNRLKHEKTLMRHLISKPEDYNGALRQLPRNLQMMFVQSYQSHLFNLMLSERISKKDLLPHDGETACGFNSYGFIDSDGRGNEVTVGHIIGYDSKIMEEEEDILWREGIEAANFRIRGLPELSMRGSLRPLLVNVKDLRLTDKKRGACTIRFELPKGSYATAAIRELTDVKRA